MQRLDPNRAGGNDASLLASLDDLDAAIAAVDRLLGAPLRNEMVCVDGGEGQGGRG